MGVEPEDERPAAVVQVNDGRLPRAKVFVWPNRPRSKAQIKRDRYVLNLRAQHRQFKEALSAVERFFVVCEVPKKYQKPIRKAHEEALEDLSRRFQEKLNEYDRRITKGS